MEFPGRRLQILYNGPGGEASLTSIQASDLKACGLSYQAMGVESWQRD